MTNEPLDYFKDESGEQSIIGRIAEVPLDTEKRLPVRFVVAFSLVATVITLFVIGASAAATIAVQVIFIPSSAYHYLEFGLLPWEGWDRKVFNIPMIWQLAQLGWGIVLLSIVISAVALVEAGDSG